MKEGKFDIHSEINKINRYFVDKILAGDFEIIDIGKCVGYLKIDGKYTFNLWINVVRSLECYHEHNHVNFLILEFTDDEKQKIFDMMTRKREECADMIKKKGEARERETLAKLKAKYEPDTTSGE